MELLSTVPLLIIDDLGMRKLPPTAAEELLEIVMRRYERTSTLLTSNRPVEDWGKLLGDTAAVTAMLDRLLHHGHVLKCGPRSWRTKTQLPDTKRTKEGGYFLIGFIALCQSRSLENQTGHRRYPASVLAPESALGLLPSIALSSAQADRILTANQKRLLI